MGINKMKRQLNNFIESESINAPLKLGGVMELLKALAEPEEPPPPIVLYHKDTIPKTMLAPLVEVLKNTSPNTHLWIDYCAFRCAIETVLKEAGLI